MPLIDDEYQLPIELRTLPVTVQAAFIHGLERLLPEHYEAYEVEWSAWFAKIHKHEGLDRIHTLFFIQLPLSDLHLKTDFLKTPFLLSLINDAPPIVWDWCECYFKPISRLVDVQAFNQALQQFNLFCELVTTEQLIPHLAKPPTHLMSYQDRDNHYFASVLTALTKARNKSLQARSIDRLPPLAQIERGFSLQLPFVAKAMLCNGEITVPSKKELSECSDFETFSALSRARLTRDIELECGAETGEQALGEPVTGLSDKAMGVTDDRIQAPTERVRRYQQWDLFCTHLAEVSSQKLAKHHQLLLAQCALKAIANPFEDYELPQLITLSIHIKETLGIELFYKLFTLKVDLPQRTLKNYLECCQLLVELQSEPISQTVMAEYLHHSTLNLVHLLDVLRTAHAAYLEKKYPQRDIDAVMAAFSQTSEIVHTPLSAPELDKIKDEYLKIQAAGRAFGRLPKDKIKVSLYRHDKYTTLYLITEMVRKHFKIAPYDTQLLSLLALLETPEKLKGRIAQIKTGEGKSTIIAMLAAFVAAQGHFVDVITSSGYLSIRDQEKYAPFFTALGLTSSHICYSGKELKKEHFHAQILYGKNTDFEFAHMRDGIYNRKFRFSLKEGQLVPRTADAVIVDEADNLFLDTASSSARLAIPSHEHIEWIYAPLLAFGKLHLSKEQKPTHLHLPLLRHQLLTLEDEKYQEVVHGLSDGRLLKLLDSTREALFKTHENIHYVIKLARNDDGSTEKQVVIMDYDNTGRASVGQRWSAGVHQLVEEKHGFKPKSESMTATSLTHANFFNDYRLIYGLTGTMGEPAERAEILNIYHVDAFDVPPHFPCHRQALPAKFDADTPAHYETILADILKTQQAGRPVLVLFKTVASSKAFSEFLASKSMRHQLLNEMQQENEDYLISRAGEAKMITVATNTAGRGTDIILSPESKANGGLHVVFTFFPNNLRVEEQGFGRASRQGQSGSWAMYLCAEDDHIKKLLRGVELMDGDDIIDKLYILRTQKIIRKSEARMHYVKMEALFFAKQHLFFQEMKIMFSLTDSVDIQSELTELCRQMLREPIEIDSIDDNFIPELRAQARILQAQTNPDWTGFVNHFIGAYTYHLQDIWARFYTQLQDLRRDETCTDVAERVESLYVEVRQKLAPFLTTHKENMLNCLHSILSDARFGVTVKASAAPAMTLFATEENPLALYQASLVLLEERQYEAAAKTASDALKRFQSKLGARAVECGRCFSILAACMRELNRPTLLSETCRVESELLGNIPEVLLHTARPASMH
ncbi:MAG: hypothetical protein NTW08_09815 [Gammaproteobacteria bacterium]|nr:hypothetical protein [Gammaproteobacteria bacterium]